MNYKFRPSFKPKGMGSKQKEETAKEDYKFPFPKVLDHQRLGDGIAFGYIDDAKRIIDIFSKEVIPLLEKFALCDDEHVNKYLRRCTSFKAIYDDIINAPGGKMVLKCMQEEKEDFYGPFRSREYAHVRIDKDTGQLVYKTHTPEVDKQLALVTELWEQWRATDDEDSRNSIKKRIDNIHEMIEGRLIWKKLPMTPEDDGFKWRLLPQATGDKVTPTVDGIIYKNGQFSIDRALYEQRAIIEPTDRQRELYDVAAQICDLLKQHGYAQGLGNLILWDEKGHVIPNMKGILGMEETLKGCVKIYEDSIYNVW